MSNDVKALNSNIKPVKDAPARCRRIIASIVNDRMDVDSACAKESVSIVSFYGYLDRFKELGELYEQHKAGITEIHYARCSELISLVFNGLAITDALQKMQMHPATFDHWCNRVPSLKQSMESARKNRADRLVDEIITIADSVGNPHAARNRIEARKWIASKLNSQVYGDKLDLNVNQTVDIAGAIAEARQRALGAVIEVKARKLMLDSSELNKHSNVEAHELNKHPSVEAHEPAELVSDDGSQDLESLLK